jgi:hypothetical protein
MFLRGRILLPLLYYLYHLQVAVLTTALLLALAATAIATAAAAAAAPAASAEPIQQLVREGTQRHHCQKGGGCKYRCPPPCSTMLRL